MLHKLKSWLSNKSSLEALLRQRVKILVGVLVIIVLVAVYFYRQYTVLKTNPQAAAENEVQKLVQQVGRLIVLPSDETPTVATVSDPEKLKNQPFFANAKAGYKVLIYTNAKKAILYDFVNNKIVEVAPLNIGSHNQ